MATRPNDLRGLLAGTLPTSPMARDATTAYPPPPPNAIRALMDQVSQARKAGYSDQEIDAALQRDAGVSLQQFERQTNVTGANLLRAGTMGATLGFADEIIGAMRHASGDYGRGPISYKQARNEIRQPYETFRAARPVVSTGAELLGGLLSPGAMAGTAPAKGITQAGLRASGIAALTGGVAGAGYAPELQDVPGQSLRGAAFAGPLGFLLGAGGQAARQGIFGTSGRRLENAIQAEGGRGEIAQRAEALTQTGRGDFPLASVSPYLRGEAEFTATRLPRTFARERPRVAELRGSEADRLIEDVSQLTNAPAVGDVALRQARSTQFAPLYKAIEDVPVSEPGVLDVVRQVSSHDLMTGKPARLARRILGDVGENAETPVRFQRLNDLRIMLRDAQNAAFQAGEGGAGAAYEQAANKLDELLEGAVPEFRAVQNAYREFSRPINIIELAKLETSRQGRVAPMLDRAGRQLRRELRNAFGSEDAYQQFMKRVAQEGDLAEFESQALRGSPTARRLESTGGIQAEDISTTIYPTKLVPRIASRFIPRALNERAARQMDPILFAPARNYQEAYRMIDDLLRRQGAGRFALNIAPRSAGLLFGR